MSAASYALERVESALWPSPSPAHAPSPRFARLGFTLALANARTLRHPVACALIDHARVWGAERGHIVLPDADQPAGAGRLTAPARAQ